MAGNEWGTLGYTFTPVNGVPILLITARGPSCINKSGLIDEYLKDLLKIIKTTNRLKIPTGTMFFLYVAILQYRWVV